MQMDTTKRETCNRYARQLTHLLQPMWQADTYSKKPRTLYDNCIASRRKSELLLPDIELSNISSNSPSWITKIRILHEPSLMRQRVWTTHCNHCTNYILPCTISKHREGNYINPGRKEHDAPYIEHAKVLTLQAGCVSLKDQVCANTPLRSQFWVSTGMGDMLLGNISASLHCGTTLFGSQKSLHIKVQRTSHGHCIAAFHRKSSDMPPHIDPTKKPTLQAGWCK